MVHLNTDILRKTGNDRVTLSSGAFAWHAFPGYNLMQTQNNFALLVARVNVQDRNTLASRS